MLFSVNWKWTGTGTVKLWKVESRSDDRFMIHSIFVGFFLNKAVDLVHKNSGRLLHDSGWSGFQVYLTRLIYEQIVQPEFMSWMTNSLTKCANAIEDSFTNQRLWSLFHRRNFTQELGTLGRYSVCFHRRNQDLNKVLGTFSKVLNFRGRDLGPEHADWLTLCSTVFQPTYSLIYFLYYCYCVMKCSFKSVSGENVVV